MSGYTDKNVHDIACRLNQLGIIPVSLFDMVAHHLEQQVLLITVYLVQRALRYRQMMGDVVHLDIAHPMPHEQFGSTSHDLAPQRLTILCRFLSSHFGVQKYIKMMKRRRKND